MNQLIFLNLTTSILEDTDTISSIAYQTKQYLDDNSQTHIIITNESPLSYYEQIDKYQLDRGLKHSQSRYGFALTHQQAIQTNLRISEQLLEHLNIITLNPVTMIQTDAEEINIFHSDIIENLLISGFIPMLHETPVLDLSQSSATPDITQLIIHTAKHFNTLNQYQNVSIYHLTNTDGIPDLQGNTVPQITASNDEEIIAQLQRKGDPHNYIDKIHAALQLTRSNITTTITNAQTHRSIFSSNQDRSHTTIS